MCKDSSQKMKLASTLKVLSILLFTIGVASCENKKVDIEYVKSALWQWEQGFKIGDGDFVNFDTSDFHTISHDTIFRKGIPRCIIVETNRSKYLMKVKSLTGEIGYYTDSEQFTK